MENESPVGEGFLPPGCTPTEWITLRWETVSSHRNLGCPWEGECLEYAGRRRWAGMSCRRCREFIERKAKRSGSAAKRRNHDSR